MARRIEAYDIQLVEDKIRSDEYFNTDEISEQINKLFADFTSQNLLLPQIINTFLNGAKGLEISKNNDHALTTSESLSVEINNLLEKFKLLNKNDPEYLPLKNRIVELQDKMADSIQQAALNTDQVGNIANQLKSDLQKLKAELNEKKEFFDRKLKSLKKKNKVRITLLYAIGFSIALSITLFINQLTEGFKQTFYFVLLITAIGFIIEETLIAPFKSIIAIKLHRANFLEIIDILKGYYTKYDREMDKIRTALKIGKMDPLDKFLADLLNKMNP